MEYSKHYMNYRTNRKDRIEAYGIGEVILETVSYDKKRKKEFLYRLTDKAIIMVSPTDRPNYIITQYFANASRVSRLYQLNHSNPPFWLINLARNNDNINYWHFAQRLQKAFVQFYFAAWACFLVSIML